MPDRKLVLLPLLLGLFLTVVPDNLSAQQRYSYSEAHMGTTFRIVLYADRAAQADSAAAEAFRMIAHLNSLLSDYDPESELSRLSRSSGRDSTVAVSTHLYHLLQQSRKLSETTGGAFDVTVGPYVELWRALNRQADPQLPSSRVIAERGSRVGYRHIILDAQRQTVQLTRKGMKLDLGGIAKGYAADQALQVLKQYGITSALVDGGGDIVLGEAPPGRASWTVEVLTHDRSGMRAPILLQLANRAVATSGDLFQYVEIGRERYSHILDPRTGLGMTDRRQVTVIAPCGMLADAMASAASVLPPEKALQWVGGRPGSAILLEQMKGDSVVHRQAGKFDQYRATAPSPGY